MIERIDKLMPSSLKRGGIDRQVKTALTADLIEQAVRGRLGDCGDQFRVRRVKDSVSRIVCANSALAEEIRLLEPELLEEINHKLEGERLERIVATS
jgi:hypothetical protein